MDELPVGRWQEEARRWIAKERKIRHELESMAMELPIGVGALSWITLELEIRGWDRFQNRRQIASYTGLCPGIHNSNGRGREGSINRCGNSVVRYTLIEMVWRMLRWQPDYPPLKKLRRLWSVNEANGGSLWPLLGAWQSTCGAGPPVEPPPKNLGYG